MDVRPQAHDIIRTWLFSTVLRSELEHGSLPWTNAAISGWVLDPDRKKMSKSKGNVVTPMALLEEHGSDGVRYWAASGRPGTDTAFDTGQMKVGRRLAIKLLNASQFVLARPEPRGPVTGRVDRGLLTTLARLVREATADLDGYNYARVLERDGDVLLVVLRRLPRARQGPALRRSGCRSWPRRRTARCSRRCRRCCALFAPFLPFVTEEVWSWWQDGSVHRAPWPTPEEVLAACGPLKTSDESGVRGAGVRERRSRRHPQEEVGGAAAAQDPRGARRNPGAGGAASAAE